LSNGGNALLVFGELEWRRVRAGRYETKPHSSYAGSFVSERVATRSWALHWRGRGMRKFICAGLTHQENQRRALEEVRRV